MDFFKKLYSYFYFQSWRWGLWTPPDRKILKKDILGYLAESNDHQKILFVGVRDYCQKYTELFQNKEYYTIDPDPSARAWGSSRHFVSTLQNLPSLIGDFNFDAIIINGVIGYGLNEHAEAEEALDVCKKILSPRGNIIIGINPENTAQVKYEKLESLKNFSPWKMPRLGTSFLHIRFPFHRHLSHNYYFYTHGERDLLC